MATTTMAATAKTKRTKKRCRKSIVAEAGSLYDIMHDHSGTSLFVLPICWTDFHTQILGCDFIQTPPQKTPMPSSGSSGSPRRTPRTSVTVQAIIRDLDILMSTETPHNMLAKNRSMKNIMATLFPTSLSKGKTCADLGIRFGRRFYPKAVRCQILWKHPDASLSFDSATTWTASRSTSQLMASMHVNIASDAPVLAYVNRSHLDHIRRNCFRVVQGPGKSYNWPVRNLQMLRSKSLIPNNIDEDHYLVAVIIAMAQQSVYGSGINQIFVPRDVKVRLLTTSEEDDAFIVYNATVPAAFMAMFDAPAKAPGGDAKLNIEYTQVPIWPVLGLKERLGQALGKDVVGDFDGNNIETYEDKESTSLFEASTSPKRRREVLSEVLNASFSEDREPPCDDGIGKRRCLEEGMAGNESQSAAILNAAKAALWRDFAKRAANDENNGENAV